VGAQASCLWRKCRAGIAQHHYYPCGNPTGSEALPFLLVPKLLLGNLGKGATLKGNPMKIKIIVHEAEEGGYWAEVPAIPGCATQGETFEELLQNLYEAI
jgi:hypothetical protein